MLGLLGARRKRKEYIENEKKSLEKILSRQRKGKIPMVINTHGLLRCLVERPSRVKCLQPMHFGARGSQNKVVNWKMWGLRVSTSKETSYSASLCILTCSFQMVRQQGMNFYIANVVLNMVQSHKMTSELEKICLNQTVFTL